MPTAQVARTAVTSRLGARAQAKAPAGGAGSGGGASGGVHAYAASCGMAACFAALFFAPLGSTAFVIELSRYDRSVWRHAPFMLLACFVAFGLASIIGHRRCHPQGAAACAVMARCRPMRRDRRRLRAGGNRLHSNHRRRPAPHQAHLAELLPVGSPGWRAHGGAGHAVRLARVRGHGRQPALRRARRPRRPGGPSP